jgi:hypothetical protein
MMANGRMGPVCVKGVPRGLHAPGADGVQVENFSCASFDFCGGSDISYFSYIPYIQYFLTFTYIHHLLTDENYKRGLNRNAGYKRLFYSLRFDLHRLL